MSRCARKQFYHHNKMYSTVFILITIYVADLRRNRNRNNRRRSSGFAQTALRGLDGGAERDRIGDIGNSDGVNAGSFDADIAVAQHPSPQSLGDPHPSMFCNAISLVLSENECGFFHEAVGGDAGPPSSICGSSWRRRYGIPMRHQKSRISAAHALKLYHQWKCALAIMRSSAPSDCSIYGIDPSMAALASHHTPSSGARLPGAAPARYRATPAVSGTRAERTG